jgi:hypothetical protein
MQAAATAKCPTDLGFEFVASADDPYFSLRPGHRGILEAQLDGEAVRMEITVLRERESLTIVSSDGVPLTLEAGVVEEREFRDGSLRSVARLLVCPVNAEDRHLLFR